MTIIYVIVYNKNVVETSLIKKGGDNLEYRDSEIEAYHKFTDELRKKKDKQNELEYYEYIKSNKYIFDREYHMGQLKKKGFIF